MHKFLANMRNLPLLIAFACVLLSCSGGQDRYVQISGYAQGGTYTVKINMKGVGVPVETVRDSVDAILNTIDTTLSGYNRSSQLARFNEGEKICPSSMFLEMYRMAYMFWERSGGALDFAAGPLFDAWGFGFRNSSFPTDDEITSLRASCGMALLPPELPVQEGILDPAEIGSPRLNYNAVAQGYSCDLVARYLYGIGVKDMLVDIGEIWCDGLNPAGQPWAVGIDRPNDRGENDQEKKAMESVWTSDGKPCGMVTSGNYRKFYVKDGRKYAHTINPVTGYPVEHNLLSATVVSSLSAAEADAVATWCMVLGLEDAKKLILDDSSLEGCLTYEAPDGSMQQWFSPGFSLRKR